MPSVLKLSMLRRPGGVVLGKLTSVPITPKQVRNGYDYAKQYRDGLERLMPFTRLDLVIDSSGGLVESACGLLDALEDLDRPVRVLIDGVCYSAATLVAVCAKETCITPGSRIMIHTPRLASYKKAEGIWSPVTKLGNLATARTFSQAYHDKTGQPRQLIKEWMKAERTFTAQEAVDAGFCDRIMNRWEWENDHI